MQEEISNIAVYLQISQFREGVHDDTKDDVESNGCEEDKEDHLIQNKEAKVLECVLKGVSSQHLKYRIEDPIHPEYTDTVKYQTILIYCLVPYHMTQTSKWHKKRNLEYLLTFDFHL